MPDFSSKEIRDLWFMEAVFESPVSIAYLYHPQLVANALWRPNLGLDKEDVSNGLVSLASRNLIGIARKVDDPFIGGLALSRIDRNLIDRISTENPWSAKHVYYLTPRGGLLFEELAVPDWSKYVRWNHVGHRGAASEDCATEIGGDRDDINKEADAEIIDLEACSVSTIQRYFKSFICWNHQDELWARVGEPFELSGWDPIYWKKMAGGFQQRYCVRPKSSSQLRKPGEYTPPKNYIWRKFGFSSECEVILTAKSA